MRFLAELIGSVCVREGADSGIFALSCQSLREITAPDLQRFTGVPMLSAAESVIPSRV